MRKASAGPGPGAFGNWSAVGCVEPAEVQGVCVESENEGKAPRDCLGRVGIVPMRRSYGPSPVARQEFPPRFMAEVSVQTGIQFMSKQK